MKKIAILAAKKQTQFKPNLTQNKPNFFKGQKWCGTLELWRKTEYDDNDTIK